MNFMSQPMPADLPVPSVIFMDSSMPNLDGLEATQQIRALGHSGLLRGCTGNVMAEQIVDFIAAGADAVVAKPMDLSKVLALITAKFHA